jgi:hypothetical protein
MIRNENHGSVSKFFVCIAAGKTWKHAYYTVVKQSVSLQIAVLPRGNVRIFREEMVVKGVEEADIAY